MFEELYREKMKRIPLDQIAAGEMQPRKCFSESELNSLAESIRENGVLQPILVRKSPNGYELIAGERRVRAARMAGLREIPALIRSLTDTDAAVASLTENLQRSDLSFFEEAEGIAELIRSGKLTQEAAAARLKCTQPTIANKLRLLRFSDEERAEILQGGLTERHARCLLSVADPETRMKLIRRVAAQGLNVSQTEKLVHNASQDAPKRRRLFIAKDVRLFYNTIDRAVRLMNESGVETEQKKIETDEFTEIRIRIPKAPCVGVVAHQATEL